VIPQNLISSTTGKMEPLSLRESLICDLFMSFLHIPGLKKKRDHASISSRQSWRDCSECFHDRAPWMIA